jgi:hypothetical protein
MAKRAKIIKVGLDFDGVVAYNPLRIARVPIKFLKRDVFGITKLHFLVPKKWWEKILMKFYYMGSIFPEKGLPLLKQLVKENKVEAYVISGRFGFLDNNLKTWINKQGLDKSIKKIYINEKSEQPHLFKERVIKELKLDYYIEDNLDIVLYLENKINKPDTKIYWIYNILDSNKNYPEKFPYLEKALGRICGYENTV